tara:strand:- start:4140 stop:4844 length:705 start_codon:yes stop_codon:yes gene_type:complete
MADELTLEQIDGLDEEQTAGIGSRLFDLINQLNTKEQGSTGSESKQFKSMTRPDYKSDINSFGQDIAQMRRSIGGLGDVSAEIQRPRGLMPRGGGKKIREVLAQREQMNQQRQGGQMPMQGNYPPPTPGSYQNMLSAAGQQAQSFGSQLGQPPANNPYQNMVSAYQQNQILGGQLPQGNMIQQPNFQQFGPPIQQQQQMPQQMQQRPQQPIYQPLGQPSPTPNSPYQVAPRFQY